MPATGLGNVVRVSYRVFARKYRPQTFDEVVGQDHITRTLQNAVAANRLAQAYLFVGPRGIGKTSTARILAKALNCVNGPTVTPCGVCDACKEITDGRSLDVIEIDGASNNGVENIRDLRDNAAYAPARGPFKIYLIDEVHMLSTGAFNALLKTLEEPPPHVKFIFATTEAQKLPATITSRCQRFDLRRIPADLIAKHLAFIADSEKISLDADAAEAIARGAEGGLRDAESMLDQMVAFCGDKIAAQDVMDVFGFTSKESVIGLADSLAARDAGTALAIVSGLSEAGKDLSRFTADLVSHFRDLLVAQATGTACPLPQAKLLDLVDHFGEAESRMKWVADKKLQLDVAVIKALHLIDETSLTDVIKTLEAIRAGEPPVVREAPPARRVAAPAPALAETRAHGRPAGEDIASAGTLGKQPGATPVSHVPDVGRPSRLPSLFEKEAATPVSPVPEAAPATVTSSSLSTTNESVDSESASVSAATIWESISQTFAKDSFIRFGWLRDGLFERLEAGQLFVRFPASAQEASETVFMEKGRKDIDARLSRELSQPVRIMFEFDENIVVPPPESEPYSREPDEPPKPAEPTPPKPIDLMGDFKNDPLIKKALEIFKSSLQTTT